MPIILIWYIWPCTRIPHYLLVARIPQYCGIRGLKFSKFCIFLAFVPFLTKISPLHAPRFPLSNEPRASKKDQQTAKIQPHKCAPSPIFEPSKARHPVLTLLILSMSADADAASSSSSPLCPESFATGTSSSCAGAQEVTESVAISAKNSDSNDDFPSEMESLNCEDPAPLGPDPNDETNDQ